MTTLKLNIELADWQIELLNNNSTCKVIIEGEFLKKAINNKYRSTINVEVIPINDKLPEPEHTEFRKAFADYNSKHRKIITDKVSGCLIQTGYSGNSDEPEPGSEADVDSNRYKAWFAKHLGIKL